MTVHFLWERTLLNDPGSRSAMIETHAGMQGVFVVQKNGQLYAYRNLCPHTGVNLEWVAHQFLTADDAFIQCAMHGALFAIETGLCVHGPCLGQGLQALSVKFSEDGRIGVELPETADISTPP